MDKERKEGRPKKKRKKSTYVLWAVLLVVYLALAFNTYATKRLDEKYSSKVEWDSEIKGHHEKHGNEWVSAGGCRFFGDETMAAVDILHVFYNEQHPDMRISLSIHENKLGKKTYWLWFEDSVSDEDFYGVGLFVDENFNPIFRDDVRYAPETIRMMADLHEELERIVEIANEKWDLDLHYEYTSDTEL